MTVRPRLTILSKLFHKPEFWVVVAVLGIKILLVVWGASVFNFQQHPQETVLSIWDRWDAHAYELIAEERYNASSAAPDYLAFLSHFPPVYPALIRMVHTVTFLSYRDSAFLISWLSILAASVLLFRLVLNLGKSRSVAWTSVLLLNLLPTAYFSIAPYTEALFVLEAIVVFFALRKERFTFAGAITGLAILTRLMGVVLLPVLLVYAIRKRRFSFLVLPVLAIVGYLLMNAIYFHDPLYFFHEYKINIFSGKHLIIPFSEFASSWGTMIMRKFHLDTGFMMTIGWSAIFTLLGLIATGWAALKKKLPIEYLLYTFGIMLFYASFSWGISNARYIWSAFPLAIIGAQIESRWKKVALMVLCAVFLLYFTKLYVRGGWAF